MAAEHAIDPSGRHAAFGQRLLDFEEDVGMHLVAAPTLRLKHPEEPCILHLGDALGGDIALKSATPGAFLEHGYHGLRAGDQFIMGWRRGRSFDLLRCRHGTLLAHLIRLYAGNS